MSRPSSAAFAPDVPPLDAPLDLPALVAQYDAATADAEALAAGLSEAQGRWRHRPGAWSVAECVSHLAVLNRTYLDGLARTVADARAAGRTGRGPWRLSWFGRTFTRAMGPVTGNGLGRKLPAPAAYVPPSDVTLAAALADFREVQRALVERVRAADGLDLDAILVRSPAWPMLRFSLLTAFAALAAHERRHLAQARRVRAQPGFPAV
jgi:hypothetical protein